MTTAKRVPHILISRVGDGPEVAAAHGLFVEYAASLAVDLGFQGFDQELAALPGEYSPPRGVLLLAWERDTAVGCVAVRPFTGNEAELKRLFVRPSARGTGLGRRLAEHAIEAAREMGYTRLRLDTLPTMYAARALYTSLGFRETPAYRINPIAGTVFMALDLSPGPTGPGGEPPRG